MSGAGDAFPRLQNEGKGCLAVEGSKDFRKAGQAGMGVWAEPPGWAGSGKGRNCHTAMVSCQP